MSTNQNFGIDIIRITHELFTIIISVGVCYYDSDKVNLSYSFVDRASLICSQDNRNKFCEYYPSNNDKTCNPTFVFIAIFSLLGPIAGFEPSVLALTLSCCTTIYLKCCKVHRHQGKCTTGRTIRLFMVFISIGVENVEMVLKIFLVRKSFFRCPYCFRETQRPVL